MKISAEQITSVAEAEKSFKNASQIADKYGTAVITDDDNPKYMLIAITEEELKKAHDKTVDEIAKRIFEQYSAAFAELAK